MMIECVEGMVVKDRRKLFHISIDGYRHATRGIGYRLRKEARRERRKKYTIETWERKEMN